MKNLIISEKSIFELAFESNPDEEELYLIQRIAYHDWISDFNDIMVPLFIIYATAHSIAPSVKTVKRSVLELGNNKKNGFELDKGKVRSRMRAVTREAAKIVGISVFRKERHRILKNLQKVNIDPEKLISGKDYLFPVMKVRLQKEFRCNGDGPQIATRLARYFEPSIEPYLKRTVKRIIES